MEQRRGRRKSVQMHAVVRYERLGLISGQARDIGSGGMSLQAGPVVVPADSAVRLHFKIPVDGGELTCDVGATVVWTRNGAMGLAFIDMEPELARALRLWTYGGMRPNFSFRKRFHG